MLESSLGPGQERLGYIRLSSSSLSHVAWGGDVAVVVVGGGGCGGGVGVMVAVLVLVCVHTHMWAYILWYASRCQRTKLRS